MANKGNKNSVKHGLSKTRLHRIWHSMYCRCYYPSTNQYKNYGGKGIKVCEEWKHIEGFINFYNWAMNNGYEKNLTLDRIDNNKNYCPSNCRWITKAEQQFNKTNTRYFEYNGQKKCLAEWAEIFGINKPTLYNRVYNLHWSIEKALETEVKQRK